MMKYARGRLADRGVQAYGAVQGGGLVNAAFELGVKAPDLDVVVAVYRGRCHEAR